MIDTKAILAVIITVISMSSAAFLVVWGAVTNNAGILSSGTALIGGALGSLITYYFAKQTIEELRNSLLKLRKKGVKDA